MRPARLVALVLLVLVPAAHAGSAADPEARDDAGDATSWPGAPTPEPMAGPIDFDAVWIEEETADHLVVALHLADLSFLDTMASNPDYVYSVAVGFDLSTYERCNDDWAAFEARATFWGDPLAPETRFDVYRHEPDDECEVEADDADGDIDIATDTVRITVPRGALDSPRAGTELLLDRIDVWTSFPYPMGASDIWAPGYDLGEPARPYVLTLSTGAPTIAGLSDLLFEDEAGDVEARGGDETDAMADAVDLLAVATTQSDDGLAVEFQVASLAAMAGSPPPYSAQYALRFQVDGSSAVQQLMAVYGPGTPSWRFGYYTDMSGVSDGSSWYDLSGRVDAGAGTVTIVAPFGEACFGTDETRKPLSAQAWLQDTEGPDAVSYDDRVGPSRDGAAGAAAMPPTGRPPCAGAPGQPAALAPEAAPDAPDARETPLPGLALAVAALALAWRRR